MINAASLLNDIRQINSNQINFDSRSYDGNEFAFSSMLENALTSQNVNKEETNYSVQQSEISSENKISDNFDDADYEETEIELSFEETQTSDNKNILAMLNDFIPKKEMTKPDFGKNNKYSNAIAGLNNLVKKNIEITDSKTSALNLLDNNNNKRNKTTIKVKNLDSKTKSGVINILKNIRSGKMSQSAGMASIAELIGSSQIGKDLKSQNQKNGKNIKVTAKITNNEKIETNLFTPEKRISLTDKTESNTKQIKTEQTKTQNTANTEVNRKYEKTKKNQATKLPENNIQQNQDAKNFNELVTEFTLKNDIQDADKVKGDVKTVLSDNKDAVFNKMVENTKTIQSQNMTKFSMVMRPENVGRMDFQLTMKDGKLNGRIILQNQEAADFFRANIEEITAVFRKANVELGKLDVSLAGQQFNAQGQEFAGQSHSDSRSYSRETLETVKAVSALKNRTISTYNSHATPATGINSDNNKVNLLI